MTDFLFFDLDAEKAVIGAALASPELLQSLDIEPDEFHDRRHQLYYFAIVALAKKGVRADPGPLEVALNGKFEQAGGMSYYSELQAANAARSGPPEYYADEVKRLARLQRINSELLGYNRDFYAGEDPSTLLSRLDKIRELSTTATSTEALGGTFADILRVVGSIEWDWAGWLPRGMLTILAGESGVGKSSLALRIAASYLARWPWPDGTQFTGEQGAVLWCEAESAQYINGNRTRDWGLPDEWIKTPLAAMDDFSLVNPDHKNALMIGLNHPDVRIAVIDSLSGADARAEKSSEDAESTRWLSSLARDTGKPIILTHHLRKKSMFDSEGVELDRLRGSSAIVQTARMVWALDTPDQQNKSWKRLQVIKSNLAAFPGPLGLQVDETGVRFGKAPEAPRVETVADRVGDLLLALLREEPLPATELQEQVEQAGMSWVSAKRAKQKLGIVSVKKDDRWVWSLPEPKGYGYDN